MLWYEAQGLPHRIRLRLLALKLIPTIYLILGSISVVNVIVVRVAQIENATNIDQAIPRLGNIIPARAR